MLGQKTMTRSSAVVPCLALLLGKLEVVQGFLPAQSFVPARHCPVSASAAASTTSAQEPPHQRTRSPRNRHDTRSSWSRARLKGGRTLLATDLSMVGSSPGGESGGSARGLIATLLCVGSLLSGPDILRLEPRQGGVETFVRPPIASALTEEQVRMGVELESRGTIVLRDAVVSARYG